MSVIILIGKTDNRSTEESRKQNDLKNEIKTEKHLMLVIYESTQNCFSDIELQDQLNLDNAGWKIVVNNKNNAMYEKECNSPSLAILEIESILKIDAVESTNIGNKPVHRFYFDGEAEKQKDNRGYYYHGYELLKFLYPYVPKNARRAVGELNELRQKYEALYTEMMTGVKKCQTSARNAKLLKTLL